MGKQPRFGMGSGPGAANGNEGGFNDFRGALQRQLGKLAFGGIHREEIENASGHGPRRDKVSERRCITDRYRKESRRDRSGEGTALT